MQKSKPVFVAEDVLFTEEHVLVFQLSANAPKFCIAKSLWNLLLTVYHGFAFYQKKQILSHHQQ